MYYHQSQYICLHLPIAKEKLFRGIEAIEAQEQEKLDREKLKEMDKHYGRHVYDPSHNHDCEQLIRQFDEEIIVQNNELDLEDTKQEIKKKRMMMQGVVQEEDSPLIKENKFGFQFNFKSSTHRNMTGEQPAKFATLQNHFKHMGSSSNRSVSPKEMNRYRPYFHNPT